MRCERLKALLASEIKDRTDAIYEAVFDEFITSGAGKKIDANNVRGIKSADYFVNFAGIAAIVELKQLYEQTTPLYEVAERSLKSGRISSGLVKSFGAVSGLTPSEMTPRDRYRLYAKWSKFIDDKLKTANKQIKATKNQLLQENIGLKGVVILNTGNYQFKPDRISNVAGVFLQKQWSNDHYADIDFCVGLSIDLFREDQNPLNGAAIGRPAKRNDCLLFLTEFLGTWTRYLSGGFGKEFSFAIDQTPPVIVDDIPYRGKVQRTEA